MLPIDLSNGSTPAVLGFEFDFDIEGGTNDNLKVELSLDGGSTYSSSPRPPVCQGWGSTMAPISTRPRPMAGFLSNSRYRMRQSTTPTPPRPRFVSE